MFDCVDKLIIMKENINYGYTPTNASIQIIEINEAGAYFGKGYKVRKWTMSIICLEGNDLKQCYECKNAMPNYISVRENDRNLINCSLL
jgi:hypothetical protein